MSSDVQESRADGEIKYTGIYISSSILASTRNILPVPARREQGVDLLAL
jgi:hypothetical protein